MSYQGIGGDIALGDLNGDGLPDILASTNGNVVSVRLNLGDGTFGTAQTIGTFDPYVVLADLNGDGNPDLISHGNENVRIALGLGNGTFAASISYEMGMDGAFDLFSNTRGLAVGDLNGDGIPDIITAGYGFDAFGENSARLSIRLGRGDGTFKAEITYWTTTSSDPQHYRDVKTADLNGDGILDIVALGVVNDVMGAAVMLGNGDGTMKAPVMYETSDRDLALGDVNGDGILDIVAAQYFSGFAVSLGNGNGTFNAYTSYPNTGVFGRVNSVALADMNLDGVLDVVTAGYQFGAVQNGIVAINRTNTESGVAPLLAFDLGTRTGALQALPYFEQTLNRLSGQRSTIGAFQSRLATATGTLQVTTENFMAAAARITDADIAAETAGLVRTGILQQAAGAVLAQANQQPALVLKLLGGTGSS